MIVKVHFRLCGKLMNTNVKGSVWCRDYLDCLYQCAIQYSQSMAPDSYYDVDCCFQFTSERWTIMLHCQYAIAHLCIDAIRHETQQSLKHETYL
jgi:hypothetical protein